LLQAAKVVEADIQLARTRAARTQRPVVVQLQQSPLELRIVDRTTGVVEKRRPLGPGAIWDLSGATMSPASVQLLPNGYASAGFTLQLAAGTETRTVVGTRAGLLRVTVP
jgi:hypothetical protein